MAWRWVAWQVAALTVLACVLLWALTPVATDLIDAHAAILAGRRVSVALVHILFTGLSREEGSADANILGLNGGTLSPIGTGVGGTGVSLMAHFA